MKTKRIFGFIFIIVAIILTLAIVGQPTKLLGAIFGVFKIFSGQLDSYQVGLVIGTFIYWLIHISLTVFLWTIGRRWTKQLKKE